MGLVGVLETFAQEIREGSDLRIHIYVKAEDLGSVPVPIRLLASHIVREAVTNAVKHGRPHQLWISTRHESRDVVFRVRDDGVGFRVDRSVPEGSNGIEMMRTRAQVGGGVLEIESVPLHGTTVTARFPHSVLGT
jgi:signal transduction histidine kinase